MSVGVLKQIWPEWQIVGKPLGRGSFGVVYKAVRRDHNVEDYAAIKVISIPADPSEVDSLRSEGLDMNATRTYFQGIVNDFVSEIQLMVSLKGVQNIVSVEDYKVVEKSGEIGWDIYIRMELLTSFNTYICDKKLSEEEVIKLGCDICTALEICAKRNIIHRDIKPENIFINDFGYFKLGDFGIARKMENMTGGLSQKGTFNYLAPEVANSSEYDARVDTYSLGIVLYRLLNGNRLPFLDTEKQLLNPNERRNAVDRRLRGEELPSPCDASPAMADLILRACAYNPDMRFASATEMNQALRSIANGTYQMAASNLDRTTSVRRAPANYDNTTSVRKAPTASNKKTAHAVNTFGSAQKKKSKLPAILSIVLVLALLVGAGAFFVKMNMDKQAEIDTIIEEAQVLADAEDFVGAIAKIEDGLDEYSDEDKLQDKLDEYQASLTNQQITALIANADVLATNGDYEGAIELVETGLTDHPDNSSLQGKITEYNAALAAQVKAKTLADAQALADIGEYESAMSMIKAAQEAYGEDKKFDTAYKSYHEAYSLTEAEAYVADGDYPGAIKLIAEAQKINANDVDLISAYNTYCNAYIAEVFAKVDACVLNRDITGAIAAVDVGLSVLSNETAFKDKKAELVAMKPISITQLKEVNNEYWDWNEWDAIDTFGNNYADKCNYFTGTNFMECSIEYRTNKEYGTLTGIIAPNDGLRDDISVSLKVYVDDVLVYNSPIVDRKTAAFTFEVDISDAEFVKIEVDAESSLSSCFCLIVADVQLWPT